MGSTEPQGETYTEGGADNGEVEVVVGKEKKKERSTLEEHVGTWGRVAWQLGCSPLPVVAGMVMIHSLLVGVMVMQMMTVVRLFVAMPFGDNGCH